VNKLTQFLSKVAIAGRRFAEFYLFNMLYPDAVRMVGQFCDRPTLISFCRVSKAIYVAVIPLIYASVSKSFYLPFAFNRAYRMKVR
jgi:hypothetical protein